MGKKTKEAWPPERHTYPAGYEIHVERNLYVAYGIYTNSAGEEEASCIRIAYAYSESGCKRRAERAIKAERLQWEMENAYKPTRWMVK